MSTDYGRFGITVPDDPDSPNGPLNFRTAVDDIGPRLGYAGAQGGKSIVSTDQTRQSASYAVLGTPDRVSNLLVPNDGDVIFVLFSALWSGDKAGAVPHTRRAALFVGGVQYKTFNNAGAPSSQEATANAGAATDYDWLYSRYDGLVSGGDVTGSATDVTTGMVAAAPLIVDRLAAGTYTVEVRYRVDDAAETLHVKSRYLRAWTKEFPASGI